MKVFTVSLVFIFFISGSSGVSSVNYHIFGFLFIYSPTNLLAKMLYSPDQVAEFLL